MAITDELQKANGFMTQPFLWMLKVMSLILLG